MHVHGGEYDPFKVEFNQIWPVGAFFLGILSTMLMDGLRARRARKEETRKALTAREQFLADRREEFELRHLLQVNEALAGLTKATATAKNEQTFQGQATPATLQAVEDANGGVVAIRHFILDESLREDVRIAHGKLLWSGRLAGSIKNPDAERDDTASDALQVARAGIAERIRSIYTQHAIQPE